MHRFMEEACKHYLSEVSCANTEWGKFLKDDVILSETKYLAELCLLGLGTDPPPSA